MFKRLVWLCVAALLAPGAASAAQTKAPAKGDTNFGPFESREPGVPYTKKRDDMRILNEHAHPLQQVYFPPESHHYQDLDTPPYQQLNRNVRILRTTNKAQLNRYVPVVYNLKQVNPFAVVRYVRRTVQLEEGGIFTFVGPGGNNGRMLVAVPEYQVPYLNELVATIDRPNLTSSDGTKRIYRQLKNRRANISDDPVLDDSAFINTFSVYLTDNEAFIIVDPEQNAVFIQDTPSGAEYLDAALTSTLDKPTPQAVLTTKIFEIDKSNNVRLGTDYIAWKNGPGANLFALGAFAEHGGTDFRDGSTASLDNSNGLGAIPPVFSHSPHGVPHTSFNNDFNSNGTNFAYKYEVNSAFFDFLAAKGKARLLNSAKVAALSTRSATITAGDQVLFYQTQTTNPSGIRPAGSPLAVNSGRTVVGTNQQVVTSPTTILNISTPNGPVDVVTPLITSTDLAPVETGLQLSLTPLIYDNGLDVSVAGELSDYNGFDDTGAPRINNRKFNTSIRMNVGEETVLGGLMREANLRAGNKVPILGKIPILGYMFGGENNRRTKREIIVAISADQIVRYDGKGYGITADDKSVIDQAEGSKKVETPASTWGFDMLGLDKDR